MLRVIRIPQNKFFLRFPVKQIKVPKVASFFLKNFIQNTAHLMKIKLLTLTSMITFSFLQAQSCEEFMDFVKSQSYGSTYTSYSSSAISYVTFYDIYMDYQTYYFAIVCFKNQYYPCSEYIYQVGRNTKMQYSMNYLNSAGKAFWKYIQPYNENLRCGPDL